MPATCNNCGCTDMELDKQMMDLIVDLAQKLGAKNSELKHSKKDADFLKDQLNKSIELLERSLEFPADGIFRRDVEKFIDQFITQ